MVAIPLVVTLAPDHKSKLIPKQSNWWKCWRVYHFVEMPLHAVKCKRRLPFYSLFKAISCKMCRASSSKIRSKVLKSDDSSLAVKNLFVSRLYSYVARLRWTHAKTLFDYTIHTKATIRRSNFHPPSGTRIMLASLDVAESPVTICALEHIFCFQSNPYISTCRLRKQLLSASYPVFFLYHCRSSRIL